MPEVVQEVAQLVDAILTALLFLMHLLILRGFLPIFVRKDNSAVWHLAASYFWISTAVAARSLYWAYSPEWLRDFLGKGLVNIVFGLGLIYGAYLVLRLLWLIIPEVDRGKYSLLTASLYPVATDWQLSLILNILCRKKDGEDK